MGTTPHGVGSGAAKGTTANVTSAGIMEIIGPSTKNSLADVPGSVSSLRMFLMPSAIGCSRPIGPTRLGPIRSCSHALTLRSASVVYATATMSTVKTAVTFIAEEIRKIDGARPFTGSVPRRAGGLAPRRAHDHAAGAHRLVGEAPERRERLERDLGARGRRATGALGHQGPD